MKTANKLLQLGAQSLALAVVAVCTGLQLQAAAPAVTPLTAYTNSIESPVCVATDAAGRCYVTDSKAGRIVVFDAFGRVASTQTDIAGPLGIAVDSAGRIYVGDEKNGSVSVFSPQWQFLFQLGAGAGEFMLPGQIAVVTGSAATTAYVCDRGANSIKVYHDGQFAFAFGSMGIGNGQFDFPAGVSVNIGGEVFVVDQNNNRVQVFDQNGVFQRSFALKAVGLTGRAQGITIDNQGRIYVADSFQGFIKVFGPQGDFLSTLGSYGEGRGQLRSPTGLAADPFGRLLVASANNRRVEVFGLDSYVHLASTSASQVAVGSSDVTLSVTLSGNGPFSFQWRRGTGDLQDGGNITGATTAQLTLSNISLPDSGDYSVVITGSDGTIASPASTLTIAQPPALANQPANQTVLSGTTVSFVVNASGDNLSFQWQLNGTDIPGATASSLLIKNVQPANAGRYTLLVSNSVVNVKSDPAVLTVITAPRQPEALSASPLADGSLQVLFNCDPGFNYVVEASTDLVEWTPLSTMVGDSVPVEFLDEDASNFPRRFYRLHWTHDLLPQLTTGQ
jgi:sugar lactone lactonase YvrE